MRANDIVRTLLSLGALAVVAPTARAQAADAPPAAQPQALKVEQQQTEHLSDKEKLARTEDTIGEMQKVLREVLRKLEEARQERDLVKLNCVNEKLTQIKALLRIAEQANVALQESVARGSEDGADHEFAKVTIAGQRTRELRAEAEQCIGELAYVVDEKTVVTVETPQGLPDTSTNPPVSPPVVVNPPVVTNPPPLSPLQ